MSRVSAQIFRSLLFGAALGLAATVMEAYGILAYVDAAGKLEGAHLVNVFASFPFFIVLGAVLGMGCGLLSIVLSRFAWYRRLDIARAGALERGALVGLMLFFYLGVMVHGQLFGKMPIQSPFSLLVTIGLVMLCAGLAFFYRSAELYILARKRLKTLVSMTLAIGLSLALASVYYRHQRHSYSKQVKSLIAQAELSGDASSQRPNVLFITIDTLRADHLSAYGYEAIRTENIDRLAHEGVLFENMIAQSSWTKTSFGSMWSSLYPSQHGANARLMIDAGGKRVLILADKLRDDAPRVAEFFSQAGYITVGINTNKLLRESDGFGRGFQLYVDCPASLNVARYSVLYSLAAKLYPALLPKYRLRNIDHQTLTGQEVYRIFQDVFAKLKGKDEPFFLWVHFMDPHTPYYAYEGSDSTTGQYNGLTPGGLLRLKKNAQDLSEAREIASSLYDGEILHVDRYVGDIVDQFEASGLLDETLVVLTSDHGEELYDHAGKSPVEDRNYTEYYRGYSHGHTMYDELLRIPLIIRFPDGRDAGSRVASVAQHIDLVPTLLDFAAIPLDGARAGFEGISLLSLLEDSGVPTERYARSEFTMIGHEVKQIRSKSHKLIYKAFDRSIEFYDLVSDPGERRDLSGSPEEPYRRMYAELLGWMARMGSSPQASPEGAIYTQREEKPGKEPSQEQKEELKKALEALGYIQ